MLKVTTTKAGLKGEQIVAGNNPSTLCKHLYDLPMSKIMSPLNTQRTMRIYTRK